MEILPLFCEIDDFCKVFEKIYDSRALSSGRRRKRATLLSQMEFSGKRCRRADCLQRQRKETVVEFEFQPNGSFDCLLVLTQY